MFHQPGTRLSERRCSVDVNRASCQHIGFLAQDTCGRFWPLGGVLGRWSREPLVLAKIPTFLGHSSLYLLMQFACEIQPMKLQQCTFEMRRMHRMRMRLCSRRWRVSNHVGLHQNVCQNILRPLIWLEEMKGLWQRAEEFPLLPLSFPHVSWKGWPRYRGWIQHLMRQELPVQFAHRHPIVSPTSVLIQHGIPVRILPKPRGNSCLQNRKRRLLHGEGGLLDEAIHVPELARKRDCLPNRLLDLAS